MSEKYYQEYGPIKRRRAAGELGPVEPPPQREPPRRREPLRRRQRRSPFRRLLVIGFGILMLLVLPYAIEIVTFNRVLDGVHLQGQPVGGMERNQIRELLEHRYADFLRTPVTLSFEERSWFPTARQLGMRFDTDQVVDDLLAAGHQGGPIERARGLWALWQNGVDVAPRLIVDVNTLQSYLTSLAPEIEQQPHNAALSIAAGRVLPTPAQPGRQLLIDETAIDILQAVQSLEPRTVVVRTRTLEPTLTDARIAAAVTEARELLATPLLLKQGEQQWTWTPEKLAELLAIQTVGGTMQVAIDHERLTKAVEKLAQLVDSPSVEPRVAFQRGKLTITKAGRTGWRLKQPEAVAAISATLHLSKREVELPVKQITPQISAQTLPKLGIIELIGEGKSSFAASASYRVTNIKAGAARMDGVLIPPDAEFSFNTQLGAVDESNGFVQGYAVIGNRTRLEWGGGVCQVSTTVFRAAFWAGLPITERHGHPFYISWYDAYSFPDQAGPGMDATIFTGVLDLKFKNDTGAWLLMETQVDEVNQVLTVQFYGARPNRIVNVRGPYIENIKPPPDQPVEINDPSLPAGTVKQTDVARKGMDIAVYRVVVENSVEQPPELFFTRFKPWPNVFVRGTGQ